MTVDDYLKTESAHSAVVPAQAGAHTPRRKLVCTVVVGLPSITPNCGYGPRPAPGRRVERGAPCTSPLDLRPQRFLDHAVKGRRLRRRLVALIGNILVALGDKRGELLVQRLAACHLPVDLIYALLRFHRAQV